MGRFFVVVYKYLDTLRLINMKQQSPINNWLKQNAWNLFLTFIGIVVAWTLFNARLSSVEAKINDFPSYDYFELKFNVLDKAINEVKDQLQDHVNK
jgi:hypothetical protein